MKPKAQAHGRLSKDQKPRSGDIGAMSPLRG